MFMAVEVAMELVTELRKILPMIRARDPKLAQQIQDAANGVGSCASEGRRRTGGDRLHLFRIAAGSAAEVQTQLRLAEAWGHVPSDRIRKALALVDRELGLLWGLTHVRRNG